MPNDFIDYLIQNMSIKEKIGQLLYIDYRKPNKKTTTMTQELEQILTNYTPGGFILFTSNIDTIETLRTLITNIQNTSTIKMFIGIDEEGKKVQRLGDKIGYSIKDTNQINISTAYQIGREVGDYLSSVQINMNMAPVMDIKTKDGIMNERALGVTKEEVTNISSLFIEGLKEKNIITIGKHFPGHGSVKIDSHIEMPISNKTKEELYNHELVPFIKNKDKVDGLMIGHILLPKIDTYPSSLSQIVLEDILRKEINFNKVVITDSLKMKALTKYYKEEEIYYRALISGNDLLLMPQSIEKAFNTIYSHINDGTISIEKINTSLKRILSLKFSSGLLENTYKTYKKTLKKQI